jgi:cation diffusion facilitator CzcD-associated flavoprotein CzcO
MKIPKAHEPDYEAIVIGGGLSGLYQIKRLTDLGVKAIALERGPDLGGTWYNNRYPGARFDSESYTYGFSFSKELLSEWHWKERFSPQPENLRYLNYVADKFDLRRHMQFNAAVEAMRFDEASDTWTLHLAGGRKLTCGIVFMAVGALSVPTKPRFAGMDSFKGLQFHTFDWPHEPLDLRGKKVAVFGTGATGIQLIAAIAPEVERLTVFQRRPNWSAPLNNAEISEAEMAEIRARYDEIFELCARSPFGFVHRPDRREQQSVPREERIALWDKLYEEPGFGIWLANFRDIFVDEEANSEFSDYIADRIRRRVSDPKVAEKLIPKDHGFGIQRVPLETRYYETYNRSNVELVDLQETPVETITPTGVRTTAADYEFDIIVYATGFDAITGGYDRMTIAGVGGQLLADKWREGPQTCYGMLVSGFPNMLMVTGPQSGSGSFNFPRAIESGIDWLTDLLKFMREHGYRRVEAAPQAEAEWTAEVKNLYGGVLMRKAKSWFTGYNSNLEGREDTSKPRYFVYNGGAVRYRKLIAAEAEAGYPSLAFEPKWEEPTRDTARVEQAVAGAATE